MEFLIGLFVGGMLVYIVFSWHADWIYNGRCEPESQRLKISKQLHKFTFYGGVFYHKITHRSVWP